MCRINGFSLIELIVVMLLVAILSLTAMPSLLGVPGFRAAQFRSEVQAALRYAQKTAVSHRRLVCATFSSTTLTLTIDHDDNDSCGTTALPLAGSASNVVQAGSGVSFSPTPPAIYFRPDGRGTDASGAVQSVTITIDGVAILIEGGSGYVGTP